MTIKINPADQFKFVSKKNILDCVHSLGLEMKMLTSPYNHPYDDDERAEPYVARHAACQQAYRLILKDDVEQALQVLDRAGVRNLLQSAINGDFEKTEEYLRAMPKGFHWVTYKGDFYGVDAGDRLNLPRVGRIANKYLPKELQSIEGSQAVAAMMTNPCTRITAPIQVL